MLQYLTDTLTDMFADPTLTLEKIVWPLFLGIIIALVAALYQKHVTGALVKKLIDSHACSPETALTLSDAGCKASFPLSYLLRKKSSVRKVLRGIPVTPSASDEERSPEEQNALYPTKEVPLSAMKFYIPQSGSEKAESLYGFDCGSILLVLLSILLFLCAALFVLKAAPQITDMLVGFFKGFGSSL